MAVMTQGDWTKHVSMTGDEAKGVTHLFLKETSSHQKPWLTYYWGRRHESCTLLTPSLLCTLSAKGPMDMNVNKWVPYAHQCAPLRRAAILLQVFPCQPMCDHYRRTSKMGAGSVWGSKMVWSDPKKFPSSLLTCFCPSPLQWQEVPPGAQLLLSQALSAPPSIAGPWWWLPTPHDGSPATTALSLSTCKNVQVEYTVLALVPCLRTQHEARIPSTPNPQQLWYLAQPATITPFPSVWKDRAAAIWWHWAYSLCNLPLNRQVCDAQ